MPGCNFNLWTLSDPFTLLLALQTPDKQRLFKGTSQLEDSKKLAEIQIGNDDILAMTFCQAGELNCFSISGFCCKRTLDPKLQPTMGDMHVLVHWQWKKPRCLHALEAYAHSLLEHWLQCSPVWQGSFWGQVPGH